MGNLTVKFEPCHWTTSGTDYCIKTNEVEFISRYLDIGQLDIFWSVSDTGWAKAAYSNFFAPWINGTCVFIDEMEEKVDPERILKVFNYNIHRMIPNL